MDSVNPSACLRTFEDVLERTDGTDWQTTKLSHYVCYVHCTIRHYHYLLGTKSKTIAEEQRATSKKNTTHSTTFFLNEGCCSLYYSIAKVRSTYLFSGQTNSSFWRQSFSIISSISGCCCMIASDFEFGAGRSLSRTLSFRTLVILLCVPPLAIL
jgi:hypothetical protein